MQYQGKPTILRLPHKLYTHRQSRKNEKLTEWNIAGRSTKRATIELQEGRSGEYWIHGGSFIGGGGCGHRSTAEEAADYMSQSPALVGLDETHERARMGGCAPLPRNDKIWVCSDELADTAKLSDQLSLGFLGVCWRLVLTILLSSSPPPS